MNTITLTVDDHLPKLTTDFGLDVAFTYGPRRGQLYVMFDGFGYVSTGRNAGFVAACEEHLPEAEARDAGVRLARVARKVNQAAQAISGHESSVQCSMWRKFGELHAGTY